LIPTSAKPQNCPPPKKKKKKKRNPNPTGGGNSLGGTEETYIEGC
jgi:hypothetical protein